MRYYWFEPVRIDFPEQAVVLPNDFLGGLDDYLGTRAQRVADFVHRRILAYEIVGPDDMSLQQLPAARRSLRSAAYIREALARARVLAHELDRADITTAIAAGNSAGGLEAVALTRTEAMPIMHLTAMDPCAMRREPPVLGQLRYVRHQYRELRRSPYNEPPEITAGRKPSAATLTRRAAFGIATASQVWRSSLAFDSLRRIASNQTAVAAWIPLARHTFTGSPEHMTALASELNQLRGQGAAFEAAVLPGTYHSYFDHPDTAIGAISRLVPLSA